MIGKIIIGKSFSGCINYCLKDKLLSSKEVAFQNRAEVIMFNKCFGNARELTQQFNEVRQLNSKLSKPVLHITLSLAPDEKLEKGTLCQMVEDCSKTFGFETNQFIAINHLDTKHQHVHIVANRIGFDKKTLSDSNNYKKMAAYCRQMELKYNLRPVLSPRRFLPKEMRQVPRSDARKQAIKNDISQCLMSSNTYHEFEAKMKDKNYQVIKGRGISFIDSKGVYVKGSDLGYSLAKIEKILHLFLYKKEALLLRTELEQLFPKKTTHSRQMEVKSQSKELSEDLKLEHSKILSDLLKPLHEDSKIPFELIKKAKRNRSQHF